jgi:hypothetical protein
MHAIGHAISSFFSNILSHSWSSAVSTTCLMKMVLARQKIIIIKKNFKTLCIFRASIPFYSFKLPRLCWGVFLSVLCPHTTYLGIKSWHLVGFADILPPFPIGTTP